MGGARRSEVCWWKISLSSTGLHASEKYDDKKQLGHETTAK
jgi:hypothetical protein